MLRIYDEPATLLSYVRRMCDVCVLCIGHATYVLRIFKCTNKNVVPWRMRSMSYVSRSMSYACSRMYDVAHLTLLVLLIMFYSKLCLSRAYRLTYMAYRVIICMRSRSAPLFSHMQYVDFLMALLISFPSSCLARALGFIVLGFAKINH